MMCSAHALAEDTCPRSMSKHYHLFSSRSDIASWITTQVVCVRLRRRIVQWSLHTGREMINRSNRRGELATPVARIGGSRGWGGN